MTRRYLHPANGCHRRNAGVDEQILLYPVRIYSYPVLFAIPEQKSEGKSTAWYFGHLNNSRII